jgi:hypothetical protein
VSALSHLLPHRKLAGQVNASVADGLTALGQSQGTLLTEKKVKARFLQSAIWGIVAGLCGAAVVAGFYDGLFQVNWYVHIGDVHFEIFWLKSWWDNLVGYPWWTLYRHGIRDYGEPAFATLAVKTLMANRKYWGVRVSGLEVGVRAAAVIVLTIVLAVLGIWLVDFSLPWAWAHIASSVGHPGYKVSAHFLGKLSVPQLALGLALIGPVVHRVWAPAGATLQGALMDRAVDRKQSVVQKASADLAASIPGYGKSISMDEAVVIDRAGWHIIPVWVRLPLIAPVIRERFSEMWRGNEQVKTRRGHRGVILTVAFFVFLVMCLGLVGAHWAALGHTVPYLFPGH